MWRRRWHECVWGWGHAALNSICATKPLSRGPKLLDHDINQLLPLCKGRPGCAQKNLLQCTALDGPHRLSLARPSRTIGQIERGVPALCLLVQKGALQQILSQPRATRLGGDHDRLDLLQGASSLGEGSKESRPPSHRHHTWGSEHQDPCCLRRIGQSPALCADSGLRHDSKPVQELLENLPAKALLADKAYDSDKIVQFA